MFKSMHVGATPRRRRFLAALLLILPAGICGASNLDGPEDFTEIAKNGFAWTVDGTPVFTENFVGSERNAYAWSMSWFQNQLYVGTLRNSHCTLRDTRDPECVAFQETGLPNESWRAEIWRYTPEGEMGLAGRWSRIFRSPNIANGALVEAAAGIPRTTPRDFGYRGMTICNAGDGVDRLYVGTAGLPANILFHNGANGGFSPTSPLGTSNGLIDLYNMDFDLSYRAMVCFKGRLWVSPSGSLEDPDASLHPVVLMNPAPAQGQRWQTQVDVSQGQPLSNPNNLGVFQMEVVGDYLYLSVGNRVEGMELWRGDGTRCLPPWQGGCTMTWEKIFDRGAGRPDDSSSSNPEVDNAGATLGVFGNDLYIGSAESAYFDLTRPELLRVRDAGGASPKWELLVGWPRPGYQADPRIGSNFECLNPGKIDESSAPSWMTALNTDKEADDDCLPATGYGPGMGTVLNSTLPSPYRNGPDRYFWRFQEYKGDFFIGTLNLDTSNRSANLGSRLWRLTDVEGTLTPETRLIFSRGLNNPLNGGIRTLAATPLGLAIGTANYGTQFLGLGFADALDRDGHPLNGAQVIVGTYTTQEEDAMPPQVSITFPANLRAYTATAFSGGCGTPYPDLCGTAVDEDGVFEVQVSLRNLATGRWWNGLAFVSTQQTWLRAEGKDNWSFAFKPLVTGVYEVVTKAIDYAGNEARRTHRFTYR